MLKYIYIILKCTIIHIFNKLVIQYIICADIHLIVKSTLEKSLICCFMSSVLKIITKLDLFTFKSTNEVYI